MTNEEEADKRTREIFDFAKTKTAMLLEQAEQEGSEKNPFVVQQKLLVTKIYIEAAARCIEVQVARLGGIKAEAILDAMQKGREMHESHEQELVEKLVDDFKKL